MKKLMLFLLVLACLIPTMFSKVDTNPLFYLDGVEKVCFVAERKFEVEGVEVVQSGNLYYNYCSLETARENIKDFNRKLRGFQFYFKDCDVQGLLTKLKCEILTTTEIGNMTVLCGYTPYYENNIYVNSHKVNLQIAETEDEVIVGFPLILTGY